MKLSKKKNTAELQQIFFSDTAGIKKSMWVVLLPAAYRAHSQARFPHGRPPVHHHFCHGGQHPPGGRLYQPPAHSEWLPAPPVSERKPNLQRPQTDFTGKIPRKLLHMLTGKILLYYL